MGRSRWTLRYECNHQGCTEMAHHDFRSRAELMMQLKWVPRDKWFCVRHTNNSEVLSPTNRVRTVEWTALDGAASKLYWGIDRPVSGFMHGPGFKAFADDFPPGTKVRVTAELILPDTEVK